MKLFLRVEKHDILLLQHPIYGNRVAALLVPLIRIIKGSKCVVGIHDLESLRNGFDGVIQSDVRTEKIAAQILIRQFDVIICHNEKMKAYLEEQRFAPEKLIALDLFEFFSREKEKREKIIRHRMLLLPAIWLKESLDTYINSYRGINGSDFIFPTKVSAMG